MADKQRLLSAENLEEVGDFTEMQAIPTTERCWRCGGRLLRLDPPYQGWRYFCHPCQHVTAPEAEISARMADVPESATGVVAAIPVHFVFIPD